MKPVTLFFFLLLASCVSAQKLTTISGYAPAYCGRNLDLYQTVDYISGRQERIAGTTVGIDSTFKISFLLDETRKLELRGMNNTAVLYANPGATYELGLPDRSPYDPFRPLGNNVEVTFYNLDTTDINYKILQFNRWSDEFVAMYYTRNNAEQEYFAHRLDTFRLNVSKYYAEDTTDLYFRAYVRYSLAKLDDLRFTGSKGRYEKYQFYLQISPVLYQNDAYMNYINAFYKRITPILPQKVNDKAYLGLVRSSPTLIFNALSDEFTLSNNRRLTELVMIKLLGEMYHSKDYPSSNVITVLDSIASDGLFAQNRLVARNMKDQLMTLSAGGLAPDFAILQDGKLTELKNFKGKYLYLIFGDENSAETQKQLILLEPIYRRYQSDVHFVSIIRSRGDKIQMGKIADVSPWTTLFVPEGHAVFETYRVETIPTYVLIDSEGYVVDSPALGPLPNGDRQTIDEKLYYINKALHSE